jgi:hypothetical protein
MVLGDLLDQTSNILLKNLLLLSWYENLNNTKEIRRFDFNNEHDQKTIYELVKNADGVIMGLPESTRIKLKLTDNDLNFNKTKLDSWNGNNNNYNLYLKGNLMALYNWDGRFSRIGE